MIYVETKPLFCTMHLCPCYYIPFLRAIESRIVSDVLVLVVLMQQQQKNSNYAWFQIDFAMQPWLIH